MTLADRIIYGVALGVLVALGIVIGLVLVIALDSEASPHGDGDCGPLTPSYHSSLCPKGPAQHDSH